MKYKIGIYSYRYTPLWFWEEDLIMIAAVRNAQLWAAAIKALKDKP